MFQFATPAQKQRVQKKSFPFLFSLWTQIPGLITTSSISSASPTLSLNHSPFLFFFLRRWPWRYFLPCLLRHTELSCFFLSPFPLFSLAGSLSLPRDSPVLCSRYRPIDFGRERKYCGHDSPCMNLMIPVLSVPSFQWRGEQINHTPFLSPSLQACQ